MVRHAFPVAGPKSKEAEDCSRREIRNVENVKSKK